MGIHLLVSTASSFVLFAIRLPVATKPKRKRKREKKKKENEDDALDSYSATLTFVEICRDSLEISHRANKNGCFHGAGSD